MQNFWWCAILFRIILPCLIIIAGCYRPTLTSYIYIVMGCYMPFFSVPTKNSMAADTGAYMKLLVVVSTLTSSLVVSSYFVLYFPSDPAFDLDHCSSLEIILRTIGVISFTDLPMKEVINWCLPEPLMLVTSILLFMAFKRLTKDNKGGETQPALEELNLLEDKNQKKVLNMISHFGKYLVCLLFCLASTLKPNVFGALYYVTFLVVLSLWANNQSLDKKLARIIACSIPVLFINITILFVYQFQYFQDRLKFQSVIGRLFSLVPFKTYKSCEDPRLFKFHSRSTTTYMMPVSIFILYCSTILVSRDILQAKDGVFNLLIALFSCKKRRNIDGRWKMTLKKLQTNLQNNKTSSIESSSLMDKIKLIIDHSLQFVFSISYLAANFMMMIWAIAFVGWKSLILLLLANLVWLMPSRKRMMLFMSPFLAIFMYFLLISAYIYSLDVTRQELPSNVGHVDFRSGINRPNDQKWIELLAKSMLGVLIFTSMRRLLQERALANQQAVENVDGSSSLTTEANDANLLSLAEPLKSPILNFFAIWWIWIVVITMLWIEFWNKSSLFRITFVALVMIFLITFQFCSFATWKKFLWFYWWIVTVYSMFNLLLLYMYQLKSTRQILLLILTKAQLEKFGLFIWHNKTERFSALVNPLFLQIAIIIQQNYLQREFNKLTSPLSPEELARKENIIQAFGPWKRQFVTTFDSFKNIFFGILEIYLLNATVLIGWLMCIYDLCALFVPCVLLFTVSCLLGRRFSKIIVYVISVFVQFLIIARLIYMNQYRHHSNWDFVGHYERNGKTFNVTLNTADWLGLHQSSLGEIFADFRQLAWCFGFVFAVTLDRIVTIRMANFRKSRNLQLPKHVVLFPDVTSANSYNSLGNMVKFLLNYGFYKFGCEISFITASIAMAMRMDAMAIPLGLWLLIMFTLSRKWMQRLWFPLLLLMGFSIPVQYVNSLGSWPTHFYNAYTLFWNSNDFRIRLQQFCHLMNMAHPPKNEKITFDVVLLLVLSRQWWAFRRERRSGDENNPAGSNKSVLHLVDNPDIVNPVPDFTTYTKNNFDTCSQILFSSWFYWSLMAAFFAGTMRPSLYSFGFILCASVILWEGSDIYLRPPNKILLRWNCFLAYNILVMIARTTSQVFGCVLKYDPDIRFNCEIFKFFAVGCVDKFKMTQGVPNMSSSASCTIHYEALGIGWDCVCFFCLIWQQRIFKSYYFIHLVNDIKAQTILANRGAELVEETRRKRREEVDAERMAIENNIAKKMERILANYDKIEAIRAGDYRYFDQVDKDINIPLVPPKEIDEEEYDSYDPMPFSEYFGLLFFTNMATVLEVTELRHRRKTALRNKAQGKPTIKTIKPGNKDADLETGLSSARKALDVMKFLWGAFESVVVSVIGIMDRATRNFRDILKEINKDIVTLKEQTNYKQAVRVGSNKIWCPIGNYKEILKEQRKIASRSRDYIHYSIYIKFFLASWNLFMAQSEWFCYLLIILYQTLKGNLMSLPMLLMTFCWGALTVPKPTKTFWVVNIACGLIIVLIKNFFDMEITPWHKNDTLYSNFFPPVLIGLYNTIKFLNIMLLFSLFFHRIVLRKLGLWKPFEYRPSSLLSDGDYFCKDGAFVAAASASSNKNQQVLSVDNLPVSMGDYFPRSLLHGVFKYAEGFRLYIQQLIYPSSTQIPVDVYLPMFLCDLVNLFLLLFFFGSFEGSTDQMGLLEYVQLNQVPSSFIIAVLIYMGFMMIDRAIYLRRNRFAKLIYHFMQVIGYHLWFFIMDPLMANRRFRSSPIVQTFYAFKCLYFLFSAYQIRNGYPTLISYHYLWHGYSMAHRFGYKLYRFIPYFLEIRCLLDWICSDSCLELVDWFKMEDVTQSLFDQKCQQESEAKCSQPSGQCYNRTTKLLVGGLLFMFLIMSLIFPFLLFSLSSTVGIATLPQKLKLALYMGRSQQIFEASVARSDIIELSDAEYLNISTTFDSIEAADEIFDAFEVEDIVVVKWSPHSMSTWDISPGSKEDLLAELENEDPFTFRLEIQYTHVGHGGQQSKRLFAETSDLAPLPNAERQNLIDIVKTKTDSSNFLLLPLIFPKFLKIDKDGRPEVLSMMEHIEVNRIIHGRNQPMESDDDADLPPDPKRLRNLLLTLRHSKTTWWQLSEECTNLDDNYVYYLTNLAHNDCNCLVLYLFNERVFSNAMNFMTQGGIMGLYLIYFLVVVNIIRSFRGDIRDIWINVLPNSSKVLRKCMEIYVARDMKNYQLEQEIFEEIVYIMRSRELMIKLTRYEDNNYDATFSLPGYNKK